MSPPIPKRGPKPKQTPPIASAIQAWLSGLSPETRRSHPSSDEELVNEAPKRFVIFEPMALLPSGSFTSPHWARLLRAVDGSSQAQLWAGIVAEVSRRNGRALTHLAINDGIPSHLATGDDHDDRHDHPGNQVIPDAEADGVSRENVLRSPTGLRMLHGDFGPAAGEDFDAAFWVSTVQNGITQVWAPRWTMFSRGNVKEKGRVLAFHEDVAGDGDEGPGWPHRAMARTGLQGAWAVDLYAGIGYFAFSYARLGLRVLCWEINPWSVEGLRRGARANGWSVRVVTAEELGEGGGEEGGSGALGRVLASGEQIVVFLEDNALALGRIRMMGERVRERVAHVNCGFLPTSEKTWRAGWEIVGGGEGGDGEGGRRRDSWLHLHENLAAADIDNRRTVIQNRFGGWAREDQEKGESTTAVVVEHVEKVKTFAPGVWHCVFDVYVSR